MTMNIVSWGIAGNRCQKFQRSWSPLQLRKVFPCTDSGSVMLTLFYGRVCPSARFHSIPRESEVRTTFLPTDAAWS